MATLMATLGEFSVYFVINNLLILAYFWLQMKNERILSLKLVGILNVLKFMNFLNF